MPVVLPDEIDNEVDTCAGSLALNHVGKFFRAVIDSHIGPKGATEVTLCIGTGRDNNLRGAA